MVAVLFSCCKGIGFLFCCFAGCGCLALFDAVWCVLLMAGWQVGLTCVKGWDWVGIGLGLGRGWVGVAFFANLCNFFFFLPFKRV